MDFLNHWKLRERPFEATWNTRFFYKSEGHLEALSRLIYLVEERTMNACLLSGEIGCGKTLTRAVFAQELDPLQFSVVTLENSGFSFEDILAAILKRLAPRAESVPATKYERCELLNVLLEQSYAAGRHVVVLLDEAQDLSKEALHELRWLTNFNSAGRAYLTLILVGQPELRRMISADPALDQRISLRFHLGPISEEAILWYLGHRLQIAGHPTGRVFTAEAAQYLYAISKGVPRELNRLAKLALEHAWVREANVVDAWGIDAVVKDLSRHQSLIAA